ncbi:SAM dependent methyltransferase [Clostridiaceae bacterium JG1575]|nr:SAM dependent methyltransferase [Clostridiaceae bacterium JG1575]
MNKKTQAKLSLFLSSLARRLEENHDFFQAVTFCFRSGQKSFQGEAAPDPQGVKLSWKGAIDVLSPSAFTALLVDECLLYDELELSYKERGHQTLLRATDKNVQVTNEEADKEAVDKEVKPSSLLHRSYLINPRDAAPLLKELGILSKDGKVKNDKIRKYNQIDHYVELLAPDLKELAKGRSRLCIADCGCGKSYLSFVLNYYLTEVLKVKVHITGIDRSESVIASSKAMADRLNYRNMTFQTGDIRSLELKEKPDLVLSLHACDTATDLALAFGIRNKAQLIVAVPCCHAELNAHYEIKELQPLLKYPILKRRMADALTDGMRCLILESEGYRTSIGEYISPLETPKNLMIKAYRTSRGNKDAQSQVLSMILTLNHAPMLYRLLQGLEEPLPEAQHREE